MRRVILFIAFVIFAGCADNRYLSEKLFWQADQKVNRILERKKEDLTENDYREIIAAYDTVVKTTPLEFLAAKAQFIIAYIHVSLGEYDKAQEMLRNIIRNFSAQVNIAARAQFAIGNIFETQQQWDKALEEYDKIIDLYPLTDFGLKMPIYIMQHYLSQKDTAGADKAFGQAQRHYASMLEEFDRTKFGARIEDFSAMAYLSKGDVEGAIKVWDEIIVKYPEEGLQVGKSLLVKAELYARRLNNIPAALSTYEKFLAQFPESKLHGQIILTMGFLALKNNDWEYAKERFQEASDKYSDNKEVGSRALYGLSLYYKKSANAAKLIEVYQTLENKYPDTKIAISAPYLLGQYYQEAKQNSLADQAFQKAIEGFKKIIAQTDDSQMRQYATNLLMICYLRSNKVQESIALLRKLADDFPAEPIYLLDLANLYRRLNDKNNAIKAYEEAIARNPDKAYVVKAARAQIETIKKELSN